MEKLKHGDYVEGLTEEQYKELLDIENYQYPEMYPAYCLSSGGIVNVHGELFHIDDGKTPMIREYDFPTFKQKCINTFGK